MSFTFIFALIALPILVLAFVLALVTKGWKAALLVGGIASILLAAAFILTVFMIVNAMNGAAA